LHEAKCVPVSKDDIQVLRDHLHQLRRHACWTATPAPLPCPAVNQVRRPMTSSLIPWPAATCWWGALRHPFSNPALTGCGFRSFPHEHYHAGRAAEVVTHVVQEIKNLLAHQPALAPRRVAALYLGGGAANLTPAEPFRQLGAG
jgi:oxygen-independent coproporphyrinogen-3 oxidase